MERVTRHFIAAILILCFVVPTHQFTRYSEDPGSCEIIGDTDVYGIGVRISFYLNWAAAYVACIFNLYDEHKGARRAILAIAIAILTNTLINTANGSFAQLEWYIVFNLILTLPIPVSIPFSWTNIKEDALGICTLLLLDCVVAVLQPWLYFNLSRQGYKDGCPAAVFLYAPVNIYNTHWVGFVKASSILGSISAGIGILALAIAIPQTVYTSLKKNRGPENSSQAIGADSPNTTVAQQDTTTDREDSKAAQVKAITRFVKTASIIAKVVLGLFGASTIAFVEETIRINDIDLSDSSISQTSQLIPFTVGVFSFVAVIWSGLKEWRHPRKKESETLKKLLRKL